ncbi:hypothetical protein CPB83DRAFT_803814 [Crepidotus variabilis]|uniref:Uncharacterized protein n=1 Tax=Crepidotus variabilis TaxID=179855 RepID=A0A9P6ERX3_9AGAR|nr:hypothetical protein CPB83DRAFT_803814 [Crepidotus variabilis]
MPRLLPRLAKEIEKQGNGFLKCYPITFAKKKRVTKSLYKAPHPKPSFHPSNYEKSILLGSNSPVTFSKDYSHHKRLPPSVSSQPSLPRDGDAPRQMSQVEFSWWANPYLRMLASPIRTCIATGATLPSDLLIRLVGLRVETPIVLGPKKEVVPATLAPDGILHPKYVSRRSGGNAIYALCWRKAIEDLQKGPFKRISAHLKYPHHLPDQVAHLLRLRVLQELELVTERLEWATRSGRNLANDAVVLRRLSREEWGLMKTTKTIPYQSAIAVLILPPPNKDPVTKKRPQPSMSALPPTDEDRPENLPPLSELLSISSDTFPDETGMLPRPEVPLYHSITAFPSRSQRAALHIFLTRILTAERHLKRLHNEKNGDKSVIPAEKFEAFSVNKSSHAFLLCSDAKTVQRGDTAAVAKALWRLRMYESEGWSTT